MTLTIKIANTGSDKVANPFLTKSLTFSYPKSRRDVAISTALSSSSATTSKSLTGTPPETAIDKTAILTNAGINSLISSANGLTLANVKLYSDSAYTTEITELSVGADEKTKTVYITFPADQMTGTGIASNTFRTSLTLT